MIKIILKIFSLGATLLGVVLLFKGDLTNGLLAMILGELFDVPKSI